MQLSDSTNLTGIFDDIDFLCGTNSTSYPTTHKARNVNRHYYKAKIDAMRASGRFQHDDFNLNSLPNDTFNLSDGVHEYKIHGTSGNLTDFLKLEAIEIKDIAGNWTRLKEIDVADLQQTITDFENVSGVPRYYDVIGNYVYLYPAPDVTQVTETNGIKVWYQRELDVFDSGDTSPEPGLPEPFHRILSLGAACDYLVVNGPMERYTSLKVDYEQLRQELREFYTSRNRDSRASFRPAHSTRNYY